MSVVAQPGGRSALGWLDRMSLAAMFVLARHTIFVFAVPLKLFDVPKIMIAARIATLMNSNNPR